MTARVLVTGFEPFGEHPSNPSAELVATLRADELPGVRLRCAVLPVSFARAPRALVDLVQEWRPDAVVSLGLACGAAALAVERVGVNVMHCSPGTADVDGAAPADEHVVPGGPDGLFATLPVRRLVAEVERAGVPAVVSNSAGTYVCNAVLYRLLHHLAQQSVACRLGAGFVHLPASPALAVGHPGRPSMTLEAMRTGLLALLSAVVEPVADPAVPASAQNADSR